jgi:CBS domain-containing protein
MREKVITQEKIKHLELDRPTFVQSGTTVRDVLSIMRKEKQNCILICAGEKCIGIFTERDFLNRILGQFIDLGRTIDNFMTPNPQTLTEEDSVGLAIQMMNQHGYRNVPFTDPNHHSWGLLRIRDIIDYLAELYPEEVLNVPPRPEQQFHEPDGA